MKLEFSGVYKNLQISDFMKIRPVETELILGDRETDSQSR